MSVANSKKAATSTQHAALAGAMARLRRGGVSSRSGRRSALLGVLTSMYANSSRGQGVAPGRPNVETRSGGSDRA
jgi:hypothetical protein